MTPRGKMPKLGSSAFAAAIAFSIGLLRRGAWRVRRRDGCDRNPVAISFQAPTAPQIVPPRHSSPSTRFWRNLIVSAARDRRPSDCVIDAVQYRDRRCCHRCKRRPPSAQNLSGFLPSARPREYCGASGAALNLMSRRNRLCWIVAGTDAEGCPSYAAQFLRLIKAVKAKSGRDQLDEANRAVNMAIRYVSDYAQHGEADRWSAPLATFATGKGDCEDYAIAKYVALREAGFPEGDLRWCWFAITPSGRIMPCWPRVSTTAG